MGEAFGCGGEVGHEDLVKITQKLTSMWKTLPKNSEGNLERRSLRYAVHRYFNREWSLQIRGFEPTRSLNSSGWGGDDILAQRVPAYVESVLESQHKLVHGFTLSDTAHAIATIEQLIFDSETALLEQAYQAKGKFISRSLGQHGLADVLELYLVKWLLRMDDAGAVALLKQDHFAIEETIPHWRQVSGYVHGQVRKMEYRRRYESEAAAAGSLARQGHNAMTSKYSFEDAHQIVASITQSFASFWDSECLSMKEALFKMDTHHTGRVPLAKFHDRGLSADWRFGESADYLRELGALDESSWRGPQVIISNYMQAASNCVVSTSHYLVCCKNDCESLLDEIEGAVESPTVDPNRLIEIVSTMNAQSTLDEDEPMQLEARLKKQLQQIATTHDGQVPLHGRLFAQWLHYAFPRQCPFPHKAGAVSTITPSEYGEKYYASSEEMATHAADANISGLPSILGKEDIRWMGQWSDEEELVAVHGPGLSAPWEATNTVRNVVMMLIFSVLGLAIAALRKSDGARKVSLPLSAVKKQHYV